MWLAGGGFRFCILVTEALHRNTTSGFGQKGRVTDRSRVMPYSDATPLSVLYHVIVPQVTGTSVLRRPRAKLVVKLHTMYERPGDSRS